MGTLSTDLRKQLESAVVGARVVSEGACRASLEGLGVFGERRPGHLGQSQAALRVGLRAKWRQLDGDQALLVAECAYEQFHRLLFARLLAENDLLLHPGFKTSVSLAECEELAVELCEPDGWSVAGRFASEILPGIFRTDDPCVRLRLAPEGRHALAEIVERLPPDVFVADDALWWVYQFWQRDKKDEVNASERKIGGADLGVVTQLFTDNYMVRFLLENSLGAWWATRHPASSLVGDWEFLRLDDDGKPAAGTFAGWPETVRDVTVMDPCCGSGHFLVEAFSMLWRMRAEEEGLDPVEAQDAVLRDNLFGLELDPRCVQIAMFAVALAVWKAGAGWRELPVPHIACSGIQVKSPVQEWVALAEGDERLESALVRLHVLFQDADTLGSLIDPKRAVEIRDPAGRQRSFDDADWDHIVPLLEAAIQSEADDPAAAVLGADAAGIARAADYLSRHYTLIATNVPYLQRGRHSQVLRRYGEADACAQQELATLFILRLVALTQPQGALAVVSPQNWLYMYSFKELRERLLRELRWRYLAVLGLGAFESITSGFVDVSLGIWSNGADEGGKYMALDLSGEEGGPSRKARELRTRSHLSWYQSAQVRNPGSRVQTRSVLIAGRPVGEFAGVKKGMSTGDAPVFVRKSWEVPEVDGEFWARVQSAPNGAERWSGCSGTILWERESGSLAAWADSVSHLNHAAQAWRLGKEFWGTRGVAVQLMGNMHTSPYSGGIFDSTVAVVVPRKSADLAPLWASISSGELAASVRSFHSKMSIEVDTILAARLDLDKWRTVAEEQFPNGLPEPWSDDATQWLFQGRPEVSTAPLQVGVGRLLGYRWPEQPQSDDLDGFVDDDGIVCLPSVAGETPAGDRLHGLLAAAFGDGWSPAKAKGLLEGSGSKKKNLTDWLRDDFFKQHCQLFGSRPFVWHVWDGRKDGFAALVNYHRLDRRTLEKLTYTYLGQDWVERQRADARDDVPGADARLAAALDLQDKLAKILAGEPPFDIFVRWKDVAEQPIGWDPDLKDGVRLNLRPFVEAGVLRSKVNVHWRKDRGKNPDGSERLNDLHYTVAEKTAARQEARQS